MDHAQEVLAAAGVGDPEVPEKAKRRRFDAAYEQRILEEAGRFPFPVGDPGISSPTVHGTGYTSGDLIQPRPIRKRPS